VTLTHTVCPTVMQGGRYPGLERNAVRYAIRTVSGCRKDVERTLGGRVAGRQRGGKTIAPKGCAGAYFPERLRAPAASRTRRRRPGYWRCCGRRATPFTPAPALRIFNGSYLMAGAKKKGIPSPTSPQN
jgi:hypothetical protein